MEYSSGSCAYICEIEYICYIKYISGSCAYICQIKYEFRGGYHMCIYIYTQYIGICMCIYT